MPGSAAPHILRASIAWGHFMRHITLAVLLAGTVSLPTLAEEARRTLTPEEIGHIFCLSRLTGDTGPLDGLLSPDLATAIAEAEELNLQWQDANPGDKPPLGDGIPWQSWPDYAAECTVGLVTLMKSDARVEITYGFPDSPDAAFTDSLLLKRIDRDDQSRVWRLDNLAYSTGGDLVAALTEAFAAP
jgi:hypothetical protein